MSGNKDIVGEAEDLDEEFAQYLSLQGHLYRSYDLHTLLNTVLLDLCC